MIFRAFAVAVVLAAALPAAAQAVQPTAPIAINRNVFNGMLKGFLPPDEVILGQKLANMTFTGFFGSASGSAVTGYVYDPASMPSLNVGDVINLATGTSASAYDAMRTQLPAGSMIVVPVVTLDGGSQEGVVCGFATLRVEKIESKANPKYIDTHLLSLDPPTLAQ